MSKTFDKATPGYTAVLLNLGVSMCHSTFLLRGRGSIILGHTVQW